MPNSLLSAFIDSLHKSTFLTVLIPLQPRLLLFVLGLFFAFFFSCPPSPSSYLVHKAFEQCFLSPVPLSGWLTFLSFHYPFGERGTARGRQYTNKAIPFYCSPIFPFSTTGSWQHHPVIPRSRAGKVTDVIPHMK